MNLQFKQCIYWIWYSDAIAGVSCNKHNYDAHKMLQNLQILITFYTGFIVMLMKNVLQWKDSKQRRVLVNSWKH